MVLINLLKGLKKYCMYIFPIRLVSLVLIYCLLLGTYAINPLACKLFLYCNIKEQTAKLYFALLYSYIMPFPISLECDELRDRELSVITKAGYFTHFSF